MAAVNKPALIVGAALLVGMFVMARRANAATSAAPSFSWPDIGLSFEPLKTYVPDVDWTFSDNPVPSWAPPNLADADMNVNAFLAAIAWAEGTDREPDPYRVCYGYRHTIRDLSDHPAVRGEWNGEPLDNLGPRYKGLVSTAAGRYQIIKQTWLRCKAALGLPDFGPQSQDRAAVWLIDKRGALGHVQAGRFDRALELCAAEWASLPASTAGQPTRQLADLRNVFASAGGTFA